jgi:hydrogenase nickel incorporation protein HypA/HybF
VIAKCENCEEEFIVENNSFVCPNCKSFNLHIIDGEDMYLMSLELDI